MNVLHRMTVYSYKILSCVPRSPGVLLRKTTYTLVYHSTVRATNTLTRLRIGQMLLVCKPLSRTKCPLPAKKARSIKIIMITRAETLYLRSRRFNAPNYRYLDILVLWAVMQHVHHTIGFVLTAISMTQDRQEPPRHARSCISPELAE